MTPKKKSSSSATPIIYGICLLVVLFVALHSAMVYEYVLFMVDRGEIEKSSQILTFLNLLSERLVSSPLEIVITSYTQNFLIWGGFGWLIVVLMIESGKKNYIHGKEFGTARWGTLSDIKDLFAENIMKEEIKRANQIKTKLGRWKVRSNLYKECEKDGKLLEKAKLEALQDQESVRKQNGSYNKKLHAEEVKRIREEVKETVQLAKWQAWKPDQLKADYESRLAEIADSPLYDEAERKEQEQKAKAEYESKLKDFFNTYLKIEKIKAKYKDADMLFTKTERISLYNWKLNNNTLILGGSGSGKTRGYVMPNILQAHSSYIVTDPKGEILEKAGYFLSEIKGYKIRVLNLDDKTLSDGYNPFIYIHPERDGYEERVLSLIETIIINTDGGEKKGGSDPFWDKAERLFLQAIFFFTCDGFVPEERNMNTVIQLIAMLQIAEDEDNYDSDLDYFAAIFERKHGSDHIGVQQWKEFRQKASGKTAKSIVISAVARLAPFRTRAVRKIFSYDTMHLDRVGEEKTVIFVVVPPTDTTFNFIAGMLFTQLFQELQYCATQVHKHEGQRLPVPCRFILDEFANTCTIPNFVKILAYARSFGIGITPILQSLEQIKNMYKNEWGVIVDNCNELLYLGSITHMDTLEYMSKLLGKGTFDKRTTGRTRGRQGSSSENFDVVGRELMTADEIRQLKKENCLLVIGGRSPFYSEKYDYTKHPNYRYTSDGNHAYSYHYTPEPPPEEKKTHPHSEDENTPAVVPEVAVEPSERAKIEIKETRLVSDPQIILRELTAKFPELQPVSDEILSDGELSPESEKNFLEALLAEDEEVESRMDSFMEPSEETKEFLANMDKDLPRLEGNPIVLLNTIGRIMRELEPMTDDMYGEEEAASTEELVQAQSEETVEEILMDEDSEVANLDEINEDIFSTVENLQNLIGDDPAFKELLEETA